MTWAPQSRYGGASASASVSDTGQLSSFAPRQEIPSPLGFLFDVGGVGSYGGRFRLESALGSHWVAAAHLRFRYGLSYIGGRMIGHEATLRYLYNRPGVSLRRHVRTFDREGGSRFGLYFDPPEYAGFDDGVEEEWIHEGRGSPWMVLGEIGYGFRARRHSRSFRSYRVSLGHTTALPDHFVMCTTHAVRSYRNFVDPA